MQAYLPSKLNGPFCIIVSVGSGTEKSFVGVHFWSGIVQHDACWHQGCIGWWCGRMRRCVIGVQQWGGLPATHCHTDMHKAPDPAPSPIFEQNGQILYTMAYGHSSTIDLLCWADKNWTNTAQPYTQYGPSYHTTLPRQSLGTTIPRFEIHLPPHQPTTYKAASINYKPSNNDNNYSHPLGNSFIRLVICGTLD
jgi:hypothetical protein